MPYGFCHTALEMAVKAFTADAEVSIRCLPQTGSYSMMCLPEQHTLLTLPIALPLGICGTLILVALVAFGCFYKRIFQELEARRSARLKGRYMVIPLCKRCPYCAKIHVPKNAQQNKLDSPLCTAILGFPGCLGCLR